MPNNMDYSLIHHSPDGTGMFLVTLPGTPDRGSYMTEQEFKEWIVSSIGGGIIPKGDILSTNLPPADDTNKGWQYYCTDLNKYAISDGTAWIYFSNSPIVQTPDATDTGHALSNAVVTQCCNEVKGRLDQHESRLENLEQKAGDYSIVQYRGTNAVPTGKAKYGLVKSIVGKTRAWNQLLLPSVQGSTVVNDVTIASDGNGVYTLNGTASSYIYTTIKSNFQNDMVVGHKYLILCNSPSGNVYLADSYSNTFDVNTAAIFDYTTSVTIWIGLHVMGGVTVNETVRPMVRDLTLIFGSGNEPSTVADALAQLPALGQYNAYDAGSLVDTEVSGVKSRDTSDNVLDTISLSETVTLRSAGSVAEVLDVETGKKTRSVRTVTYDGSDEEYWNVYSGSTFRTGDLPLKNIGYSKYNAISNRFTVVGRLNIYDNPFTFCSELNYFLIHFDSSITDVASLKTWLSNNPITINYELATPDPDEQVCDPIPDNYIEVEAGGTIDTIQTQTPVIDNCLDVGYLAV